MNDLSARTLRELLTLARERFGAGAANLKTKAELIAALSAPSDSPSAAPEAVPVVAPVPVAKAPAVELVTHDFFRRRS